VEVGDGVGEAGARWRGVDALERGGDEFFGAVDIVVGDRSVEARELWGDEFGQFDEQREVALGQVGQLAEELESSGL
jgi:hypothetical protein